MIKNSHIRSIALALAVFTVGGCVPGKGVDWPAVVSCAPGVDDLIPSVSRLLLDGGAQGDPLQLSEAAASELEKLAIKHGPEAIACIVDAVVGDWFRAGALREENGYEPDPRRHAGALRGQAFLASVGTEVQR